MRKYVDKSGGLVVEKTEQKVSDEIQIEKSNVLIAKSISASDALEAMQSYQTGNFSVVDSSEKGVCKLCGKKTSYKNRCVCVDCWKQYKDEIIDGLKNAVKDVEINID